MISRPQVTNKKVLAQALIDLQRDNNDLRIISGANVDPAGFTLLALLRNEMYFLPEFLSHYRKLGVERFVFLNDRSDDGSVEYLCDQSDTVVVESALTFGDTFEISIYPAERVIKYSAKHLWRSLLHKNFANDRWAIRVDLDEFIHLPCGMCMQDLVALLEKQDCRAVFGVMLDVYPKNISALNEQNQAYHLDLSTTWYFDGEQHLCLRKNKEPRVVHPGARARLYHTYGVDRLYQELGIKKHAKIKQLFAKFVHGKTLLKYNTIWKSVLLKWDCNSYFKSSHLTNLIPSASYLLPIQHFRFTGALYKKIKMGLCEKSYYNNSADHFMLFELLKIMEERNGSFLYGNSAPLDSFNDMLRTGNAHGL